MPCARSLDLLTRQINGRWPNRDKASDGCCASAAHHGQNPSSDHEPNLAGWCRAKDIDEDLLGVGATYPGDAHALVLFEALYARSEAEADPRIKYLIYERQIVYPRAGNRPRGRYAYNGVNAHLHHLHVSIYDWAVDDFTLWEIELQPAAPSNLEDWEMPYRPIRRGADASQPLVGIVQGHLVALHSLEEVQKYVELGLVQPGNHVDLPAKQFDTLAHALGQVHP